MPETAIMDLTDYQYSRDFGFGEVVYVSHSGGGEVGQLHTGAWLWAIAQDGRIVKQGEDFHTYYQHSHEYVTALLWSYHLGDRHPEGPDVA